MFHKGRAICSQKLCLTFPADLLDANKIPPLNHAKISLFLKNMLSVLVRITSTKAIITDTQNTFLKSKMEKIVHESSPPFPLVWGYVQNVT